MFLTCVYYDCLVLFYFSCLTILSCAGNNSKLIEDRYLIFYFTFWLSIGRKQSALLEEKRNKLNEKLEKRDKRKKKKDKNKHLGEHFCAESGSSSTRYTNY